MKLSGAEQNLCLWANYIQKRERERKNHTGWKKTELFLIIILGLVIPEAPHRQ
jgi:hypothetical protein